MSTDLRSLLRALLFRYIIFRLDHYQGTMIAAGFYEIHLPKMIYRWEF
jgi:hypothetical protein